MGHSRLSPSGAARWMACPGSVKAEAGRPSAPSLAAIDGSKTHLLLEHCLNRDFLDPLTMVGDALTYREIIDTEAEGSLPPEIANKVQNTGGDLLYLDDFTIDSGRAARVAEALAYIRRRKEEIGVCAVRAEERVDAGKWINRKDLVGTADVQLIGDTVLEVIDYKDGVFPVCAEDNPQLMIYLLGAAYPYLKGASLPFTEFRMTIIQPKLAGFGKDTVSTCTISISKFRRFMEELHKKAVATDDPNAPRIPGEVQCKWCKAKGDCPALADKALTEAQVLFKDTGLSSPETIANEDPSNFDAEKLGKVIEALPLINQFLTAVQEEALRRIQLGETIPGVKVVRGRGSRKWKVDEDALLAKFKSLGMPKDSMFTSKPLSPAQVKKVAWTNRKGEQKSLSERQLAKLEEEYIEYSPGKLIVTLESDERKAVVFDAKELFKGVSVDTPPGMPSWLS